GDVRADVHAVPPRGVELEHLVEARRAEHLGRGAADELRDVLHRVLGEVAVLLLREVAERDQRGARPGVPGDDLLGECDVRVGEPAHRSTSPMIGSTEEMIATVSARNESFIMWGRVWRFTKLGPRMCIRWGLDVPSETR